ncbi:Anaphase-promoting complex subunit 5 [Camellia lanceoleosa]|uniref:Anaphase-promoting complex subunit 5 n=1 Tax=Camellia lanceoleosa TaxID=1840588 RepID=A0ACC0HEC8_9ERIC|nr:Anaphase-promoting complex subunit 5 [Camellia lanceoleosa]
MAAGVLKAASAFAMTPHKVSVCILVQIYAPPAQISVPFPFSSVSQHNRLGLFLLALTKSSEDILEPKLYELIAQLREIGGPLNDWLSDHLTSRLSSLSSPDDLFNFFSDTRGILGGPDSSVVDDDQTILDPNSNLGIFLRRCLLAFNLLSFEGVCHLLTNIGTYCKEALSSCPTYESPCLDDCSNDLQGLLEYENMDLENFVYEKVTEEIEERKRASERVPFHNHAPQALLHLVEDFEVSALPKLKHNDRPTEVSPFPNDALRGADPPGAVFLRTNLQLQGYLLEQADAIEKNGNSFPLNAFESILKQIQKLAPELHRVHFLRYLNSLYHDDYPAALENLHRYFDYSAGTEGFDFVPPSSGCNSFGRYEIALLCLGMMHFHFGHPRQALEVLTEAVRVSQQHCDDTCLAYTLAAMCNMLSEVGISGTSGILGTSYSPVTRVGTSLSIQQQLFVLLRRSLNRAESLKLKRLVASNHIAMAKFDLTHVQRPLLSFGPKASMKLRTYPANVCKELRLSSRLISDFSTENSSLITDGAFSTAWLKNFQKPMGSLVFSQENGSGSKYDAFHSCAQPNSIPGSVLQLLGSSYLVRAIAWETYGSAPLGRINALVYATCFADSSRSADTALAYAKLVQHLAVFKGYKDAFAALKIAEEKFLSVSKSRILLLRLQLLHEHALHRGHLKLAQQLCDELGVLASSVTGVDMELKKEASFRHARTLLAANQFSQAAAVAHSLFCMCYKFGMQVENASVLLLLAEIHKRSGNAVLGIPYALASLSFCQSFNLDLLKASATLTLAELWLSLGSDHAKRASTLMHCALPIILGHGGLELRARAFIAEAKCYLSDPSFSVFEDAEVVLDPLRQAAEELQYLEYHELAAEAFYLMAIVHDKLGQQQQGEEAATSFKKHMLALENPQHSLFTCIL